MVGRQSERQAYLYEWTLEVQLEEKSIYSRIHSKKSTQQQNISNSLTWDLKNVDRIVVAVQSDI